MNNRMGAAVEPGPALLGPNRARQHRPRSRRRLEEFGSAWPTTTSNSDLNCLALWPGQLAVSRVVELGCKGYLELV
jgi:hypothetical protein